eukprot:SAG11_NODE_105_length_16528_cov_4.337635_13_plen_329_part_00
MPVAIASTAALPKIATASYSAMAPPGAFTVGALVLMRIVLGSAGAAAISSIPPANIAIAELMTDPMALSLDGTPAYYYIRRAAPGSINASKFVIHIQGGGWCSSTQSCTSRAAGNLGSSDPKKTKENSVQGGKQDLMAVHGCQNNRWCGALMVNDPATNPYAHDWNAVLLRYTDGASWIGNQLEPTEGGLYFRGAYSLRAIMRSLTTKHGLGQATEVLIGGDSAGGLATFIHIDAFADHIHATAPHAKVLGMPDSGFWPDDTAQGFSNTFDSMFKMQNNGSYYGMVKNCKWKGSNMSKCLFPQYFADEIETPLFPLQSIYDPLQKGKE